MLSELRKIAAGPTIGWGPTPNPSLNPLLQLLPFSTFFSPFYRMHPAIGTPGVILQEFLLSKILGKGTNKKMISAARKQGFDVGRLAKFIPTKEEMARSRNRM